MSPRYRLTLAMEFTAADDPDARRRVEDRDLDCAVQDMRVGPAASVVFKLQRLNGTHPPVLIERETL